MDWFYAKDGQQTGPLSEAELKALVLSGALSATSLVWHSGMETWAPFSSVFPAESSPEAIASDHRKCAQCDRSFPLDELLRYEAHFVCGECKPTFFQRIREGITPNPIEAWRSGKFLVTRKNARLPDRCLKCNSPAHGRTVVRKIQWHPWWMLLPGILAPVLFASGIVLWRQFPWIPSIAGVVSIVVFVTLAAVFKRSAEVHIGLCPEHWRTFQRHNMVVSLSTFVGIFAFITTRFLRNTLGSWIGAAFLSLLFLGPLYGAIFTKLVRTRRIKGETIWLRGASPAFLATLPEWTGQS